MGGPRHHRVELPCWLLRSAKWKRMSAAPQSLSLLTVIEAKSGEARSEEIAR
jgi:hypothetical protein